MSAGVILVTAAIMLPSVEDADWICPESELEADARLLFTLDTLVPTDAIWPERDEEAEAIAEAFEFTAARIDEVA